MTRRWALLDGLDSTTRDRVLAAARRRRFRKREVVFHEGDRGGALHLVESGRVVARVTTPRGDVATLSVIGAGQSFGELALLDDEARRTATIVAVEPTVTLALERADLVALRAEMPSVDRFVTSMLADYVERLTARYLEALYVAADRRVARRIAELSEVYPGEITLTQEDIAAMAGTSRATVNRVLGDLADVGAVTLGRGSITVTDVATVAKAGR